YGALRRLDALPPQDARRVLRPGLRTGTMRRVRLVPRGARSGAGIDRGGAEDPLVRRTRQADVGRNARRRRAAGTPDRQSGRGGPRSIVDVRFAEGGDGGGDSRLRRAVGRLRLVAARGRPVSGPAANACRRSVTARRRRLRAVSRDQTTVTK